LGCCSAVKNRPFTVSGPSPTFMRCICLLAVLSRALSIDSDAPKDLIFGVVGFDPQVGCGASCLGNKYADAVQRWVHSVRKHTSAARTDVAIFTGKRRGSIVHGNTRLRAALRAAAVRLVEGDFYDGPQRVAHSDSSRYKWCVVRNRWFVIRDFLRKHESEYRNVLMVDVRDALIQADPFAWRPRTQEWRERLPQQWLRDAMVFSGEGTGNVPTLRQSKKGLARTLQCARDASERERAALLDTDPLNAGVTMGGARAFLNFSTALSTLISRVTTTTCLDVKDCTDQGLYNLLVYAHWQAHLPHTQRVMLPIEHALSYTLGHKKRAVAVDAGGRVLNEHGEVPPVVHQFGKGFAGKSLRKSVAFRELLSKLLIAASRN
jgi:hypothetical protein